MHHVARIRQLPQILTAATPVKKGYRMLASQKSCRSNTKLVPSIGFSVNRAGNDLFPALFDLRNGSESRFNRIIETVGGNIPRSLSQPRNKSTSHIHREFNLFKNQIDIQKSRLQKSISKQPLN